MIIYLGGGMLLAVAPITLYVRFAAAPNPAVTDTGPAGLLLQSFLLLTAFGFLTWLIGRRALRMSGADLGWVSSGQPRGFGFGAVVAAALAVLSLLLAAAAGARWFPDTGGVPQYLRSVGLTTAVLAPAALAEELIFRGLPLVLLAAAFGRGTAIIVMAVIFGLAHALNPEVTPLAVGNVALAGVFLGLAFYAPGGIWTAWGAHLGWNATLAALDAPVSGLPFRIPLINFDPGTVTWFTGGSFGPEGGVTATVVLLIGCAVLARLARKDGTA